MPFPILQLIEGRNLLVTASPDQSVEEALGLMMKHDFSQLPIVDRDNIIQGIVTSDSILRGLHFTKTTTTKLHVIDIKTDAPTCLPDDEIFDVLERMRNSYACLVVDKEKHLVGIITDFDTSEYFQRRAENIMIVEDIERTLKDFILFAYPRATDGSENPDLAAAVQQAAAPPRELAHFKSAVAKYLQEAKVELSEAGLDDNKFNPKHAEVAFDVFTTRNASSKAFDDLTMAEYISLFLSDRRWKQYQAAISLEKEAIFQMLDAVRLIRNKLAHFTGEVTETEQERLRYCLKWLQNYQNKVYEAFQPSEVIEAPPIVMSSDSELTIAHTLQKTRDSRYAPLADSLKRHAESGKTTLTLKFDEIEGIIGEILPPSARNHRNWWANDNTSRVQSKQWLSAGWRVNLVDMENEKVVFEALNKSNVFENAADRARSVESMFS